MTQFIIKGKPKALKRHRVGKFGRMYDPRYKDKKDFKTGTGIDIDKGTDIKDTGITSDQMQYRLKRGGLASKK